MCSTDNQRDPFLFGEIVMETKQVIFCENCTFYKESSENPNYHWCAYWSLDEEESQDVVPNGYCNNAILKED